MTTPRQRRANNALGIAVICAVMGLESAFAHHKHPSAASPYVWSVLGCVAAFSLVYYLFHRGGGDGSQGPT